MKEHVRKLNIMLQDPKGHGTYAWAMIYAEHMKAISDYWIYN